MAARRSMREAENKLSAAIKPYLKYYYFADTDEDDKYIIGGTIGGMIIPIDLKGALD